MWILVFYSFQWKKNKDSHDSYVLVFTIITDCDDETFSRLWDCVTRAHDCRKCIFLLPATRLALPWEGGGYLGGGSVRYPGRLGHRPRAHQLLISTRPCHTAGRVSYNIYYLVVFQMRIALPFQLSGEYKWAPFEYYENYVYNVNCANSVSNWYVIYFKHFAFV